MKSSGIAQRLLDGSVAIDRMKVEVKCVVHLVLGFIEKRGFVLEPWKPLYSRSEACEWEIYADNHGKLTVACKVLRIGFGQSYAYSTQENIPFRLPAVQEVHNGLSVFVEGVLKKFPVIKEDLQFLLDAAEINN